jgi:hypothetical protein
MTRLKPKALWLLVALVFGAGLAAGVQWHRLRLFPFPQLHAWRYPPHGVLKSEKFVITRYTAGTPVYLDRPYYDTVGDERLEGLFLIQIPRHYSDDIVIRADSSLTIYRFLSDDNINTPFDSWTPTDIQVHVRGFSTAHTRVAKKDFAAGTITLNPGGPVASCPILVGVHNFRAPALGFEVLNQ